MALVKRGGPASERSRHIDIRYFWVKEKVDGKEAITKHLSTDKMFVNVMTKPVQGQQFIRERNALTNWYWIVIAEFIFIFHYRDRGPMPPC